MATGGAQAAAAVNKLTCAVCLEKFRRPKLLLCFHTFCQSCLQAVAGSSPSFPCPACRAPVLLPPGGVGALQGNFYIEQDLNKDSTPAVRLCDVCAEDREATHTCMQCQQKYCLPCRRGHDSYTFGRSHTVVALQQDGQDEESLKGDSTMKGEKEEMCPKHRNQPVILHCTACKANICMQCKLTSHEGHATEDLADTGAKAKVKLQQMLEKMALQRRDLEGLLSVIEKKQDQIKTLHQTTEDGIKARVEKAKQLLTQCRDNILESLQSLNTDVIGKLAAKGERLLQKDAALTAQSDHVTRVLREDKDADIVSLEDQLKEVTVDDLEVQQLLKELENESEPCTCEHNPAALKPVHLQEYVGQLKKSAPEKSTAQPSSDGTTLTAVAPSALPASSPPSDQAVKVSEVIYSRNSKSKIVAICTTTEKRVWIKYSPSDSKALRKICSFTPGQDRRILDACFFPVDGQEMLVVVVEGVNKLLVLDHTDGCRFVRHLDTGPVNLARPRLLATDQQTMLWIGSDGGKAVMLEL